MHLIRPCVALLALYLPFGACIAETLEEAWQIALSADKNLDSVRSLSEAAEATLAAAHASRMPVLELDTSFTQIDDTPALDLSALSSLGLDVALPDVVSNENFVNADATLSLPLYTSGLIGNSIAAASAARDGTKQKQIAVIQDLKLAVADAFVLVLRAQRALELANSNVDSLQAHASDVQNLFDKGLVPENDLLAVRVSLANAQQSQLQAANALDLSSAAYNRRLGRTLDDAVALDEVMPTLDPVANSQELEALSHDALENRSELQALHDQASALRHQGDAERSRNKPQLGASAGLTYLENNVLTDDTIATLSVGVSWRLFDGGQTKHRAGAFDRQADSASQQRDDLVSLIALQVRSTWLAFNEANARLQVTTKALQQSQENLTVARNRYTNGIGTNTEVLDAQTLRTLSQSNHNNARYDAALARLQLARAVGVL